MSQLKNARRMDDSPGMGGSGRGPRARGQPGMSRGNPPPVPELPPVTRRPLPGRDGQMGVAISRPAPTPQWPLAGPLTSPPPTDSEPYRPPPGRPPQRPPRPSRVPSILDASRIQDHTPVFQYTPQSSRASELSAAESARVSSSRPSTLSSVGSIPDFPVPVSGLPAPAAPAAPVAPPLPAPRRSMNLGPPPSSRRGASSFYSNASYVSPIPEESYTRSHTSYASSAAIPESFGNSSPSYSPREGFFFDDSLADEMLISDDADESQLVRSASVGKRAKPSLVTTSSSERTDAVRPDPKPMQRGAFPGGTGYVENSSSSSDLPKAGPGVGAALTADSILNAIEGASATDPSTVRKAAPSPRPFRMSGLRRPPRLDIDAVRAAEARGSLTSLPDLIRRATRLAALMDRGRRPASRFDELEFSEELFDRDSEKHGYNNEKHQSGLTDMLAAFPPPGSRRSMRQSVSSWPLGVRGSPRGSPMVTERPVDAQEKKRGRRCCGLPRWGFLIIVLIALCVVAAAIVVPLEIFVFRKNGNSSTSTSADCQGQQNCKNGGTSVVTQGVCSCICANGFTGTNCTVPTTQGCTMTTINTGGTNINNVTIGQSIPRLVQGALTNFSVPLSAATISSRFSSSDLSCNTENALVTFDGHSAPSKRNLARDETSLDGFTVTIPDMDATIVISEPTGTGTVMVTTLTAPTTFTGDITATTLTISVPATVPTSETTATPALTSRSTAATATTTASPTNSFNVTEEALDFARVAVLFVLQEESLDSATTAQNYLQTFISNAGYAFVTVEQATNVTVGGSNTVDLVNFFIDDGSGKIGGGTGG
ncbi:hypothetical protein GGR56DRAFT_441134 [Xylariaceae sp. FL0804]|nr:hypothetical protein GGR56DRAFT_441134 [Xylariaceae sp. FL0804]